MNISQVSSVFGIGLSRSRHKKKTYTWPEPAPAPQGKINDQLVALTTDVPGMSKRIVRTMVENPVRGIINIWQMHWSEKVLMSDIPEIALCQTQNRAAFLYLVGKMPEIGLYEEGRYKNKDGAVVRVLVDYYNQLSQAEKDSHPQIARIGALSTLEMENKLTVKCGEREDTYIASGNIPASADIATQNKILLEDRDNAFVELVVENGDVISATSWGRNHCLINNVQARNAAKPDDQTSLVTLVPECLEKYIPRPEKYVGIGG